MAHNCIKTFVLVIALSLVILNGPVYAAPLNTFTLHLNGVASFVGDDLELTSATSYQTGSAFISTPFLINENTSFSTFFQFALNGTEGAFKADGFTFILQNDPAGVDAIGIGGSALGYGDISNSLAIEFDTYPFGGSNEPNDNHIGINTNGSVSSLETSTSVPDLNSGSSLYAWIDYDGLTNHIEIFVSTTNTKPGTPDLSYSIDLYSLTSDQAFIGFSAATGGFNQQHLIEDWELNVDQPSTSIPTINEWGMIIISLLLAGSALFMIRRRRES